MNPSSKPLASCSDGHDDETVARAVQEHLLDGITASHIAEIFAALADPTRVRIIGLLTHVELCVGDLCLVLGMSQPAVSHQLRVLRTLRIVAARKDGRHGSTHWLTNTSTTCFIKASPTPRTCRVAFTGAGNHSTTTFRVGARPTLIFDPIHQ